MPKKRSEINVGTLFFIPHPIPIQSKTVEDFGNIITLLTHLIFEAPLLQLGDTTRNVLLQVTNLLNINQVTSTVLQHQI